MHKLKTRANETQYWRQYNNNEIDWGMAIVRASSYEPGNRVGSVTGTNFVVCSYVKF